MKWRWTSFLLTRVCVCVCVICGESRHTSHLTNGIYYAFWRAIMCGRTVEYIYINIYDFSRGGLTQCADFLYANRARERVWEIRSCCCWVWWYCRYLWRSDLLVGNLVLLNTIGFWRTDVYDRSLSIIYIVFSRIVSIWQFFKNLNNINIGQLKFAKDYIFKFLIITSAYQCLTHSNFYHAFI